MTIDVPDLAGTADVARRLAATLSPGACVALEGQLGAGKTTFVRLLVEALGGDPRDVSSPTYVLLHTYRTPRLIVHHLDAYRVGGADDLEAIGFGELLDAAGAITIVEWASRVCDALPAGRIEIAIGSLGDEGRRFKIRRGGGP